LKLCESPWATFSQWSVKLVRSTYHITTINCNTGTLHITGLISRSNIVTKKTLPKVALFRFKVVVNHCNDLKKSNV
jgi:hypothetical protein